MKPAMAVAAACLAAGLASAARADDLTMDRKLAGSEMSFQTKGAYHDYTLSIAGPNNFHTVLTAKDRIPNVDLRRLGATQDGTYTYQLTAATDERIDSRDNADNGRDARARAPLKSVASSGSFRVQGGEIVKSDAQEPVRRQK